MAALFVEAIMNRTPWALWDLKTGQPAEGADTEEAIEVLEKAMPSTRGTGRGGASGPAPHVHPPDGDVAVPGAGAHGRRPAYAVSCRTPAISSICRPTSTCFAATTRAAVESNQAAIEGGIASFSRARGADNFYSPLPLP